MKVLLDQEMIVGMVRGVTAEVLSTMLSIDAACEEAYTEPQVQSGAEGVVSFIGLTGKCAGTGSLRCSSDAACRLASNFLMSEYDSVNEEVIDAFGELTNMIIGNLKNQLEEHLGPMGLSIPSVIHGQSFMTGVLGRDEWTVVPFLWSGYRLDVKVCLKGEGLAPRAIRSGSSDGGK